MDFSNPQECARGAAAWETSAFAFGGEFSDEDRPDPAAEAALIQGITGFLKTPVPCTHTDIHTQHPFPLHPLTEIWAGCACFGCCPCLVLLLPTPGPSSAKFRALLPPCPRLWHLCRARSHPEAALPKLSPGVALRDPGLVLAPESLNPEPQRGKQHKEQNSSPKQSTFVFLRGGVGGLPAALLWGLLPSFPDLQGFSKPTFLLLRHLPSPPGHQHPLRVNVNELSSDQSNHQSAKLNFTKRQKEASL